MMSSPKQPPETKKTEHLLLRTARGEVVERPPVWAMRQAGRWDPEFNRVRAGMSFYEFSEDVDKAIQGTLCPRRFGVDGIILFYDITTLPVAMGLPFTLQPNLGPVPDRPIRTLSDLDRLNPDPDPERYNHIRELLKGVRRELAGELPVLFFAGAPFTVATYCIGTGKDMEGTRQFAAEHPMIWGRLLEKLQSATISFLQMMIAEGGDMYQLFDSWAGLLTPTEYENWAQTFHRAIFAQARGVPRVIFVKECPYLDKLCATGADVVSLGRCHDLAVARKTFPQLVFQGNVDEEVLQRGTTADVIEATQHCIAEGGGHRHIVNLNHGVDRATPVANFEAFISTVHKHTSSTVNRQGLPE
jgi:uroporphyrinogen decarboxylase